MCRWEVRVDRTDSTDSVGIYCPQNVIFLFRACSITKWTVDCVCVNCFSGTYAFLLSVITTDLVGLEDIGPAYGFLAMLEGVGSVLGTPVSGKYCYFSLDKLEKSCVASHDICVPYCKTSTLQFNTVYNSKRPNIRIFFDT